jgi:hypothetical protein
VPRHRRISRRLGSCLGDLADALGTLDMMNFRRSELAQTGMRLLMMRGLKVFHGAMNQAIST